MDVIINEKKIWKLVSYTKLHLEDALKMIETKKNKR